LEPYLGSCEVIEVRLGSGACIRPEHVPGPLRAPRVLFKTNSNPDPEGFAEDFVALSPDLIPHLKDQGCVLVGIDTPSLDPFQSKDLPCHHALFDAGMHNLEGLDLAAVEPGLYTLIALPLRIEDGDGSPVRAVLLKD
jgi:arylformamidase